MVRFFGIMYQSTIRYGQKHVYRSWDHTMYSRTKETGSSNYGQRCPQASGYRYIQGTWSLPVKFEILILPTKLVHLLVQVLMPAVKLLLKTTSRC
jgi:hypothetical protein